MTDTAPLQMIKEPRAAGVVSTSIGADGKWRFNIHKNGELWTSVDTFDSQQNARKAAHRAIMHNLEASCECKSR